MLVVRPLAGAGIEIAYACLILVSFGFAPSRGRELKSLFAFFTPPVAVRPLAGAGIEILTLALCCMIGSCSPPRGGGN